jgi:hypothetical protein
MQLLEKGLLLEDGKEENEGKGRRRSSTDLKECIVMMDAFHSKAEEEVTLPRNASLATLQTSHLLLLLPLPLFLLLLPRLLGREVKKKKVHKRQIK